MRPPASTAANAGALAPTLRYGVLAALSCDLATARILLSMTVRIIAHRVADTRPGQVAATSRTRQQTTSWLPERALGVTNWA